MQVCWHLFELEVPLGLPLGVSCRLTEMCGSGATPSEASVATMWKPCGWASLPRRTLRRGERIVGAQ